MRKRKKKTRKTKSAIIRKLDKIFSEIVRSKGYCVKCNKDGATVQLQTAHIFSRTYKSVRWDYHNSLCLCAGCHFWAHRNPVLFTEFVKSYLGDLGYETLKMSASCTKKWTIPELEDLYQVLKKERG
jgi:hypothetical protein